MVFPSVSLYLDPPNWQQQQSHQHGSTGENLLTPVVPTASAPTSGAGTIRPNSMAERARLAKVPLPEAALKCPRCDSTNTKFCYFNNYSLSQPRHFCKTCRRYWTKGGALRNVPVGGGCRRNKRSKGSSSSKSSASADRQSGGTSSSGAISSNPSTSDAMGLITTQPPQLPLVGPLHHHLADYGAADMGFNFGGISHALAAAAGGGGSLEMGYPMNGNLAASATVLSAQMQQFPFLSGLEPPSGLYQFEGDQGVEAAYGGGTKATTPSSGMSQLSSIKMEENQGLNLPRQFMGVSGNDQFWGGGVSGWTDLSGFSSSTSLFL